MWGNFTARNLLVFLFLTFSREYSLGSKTTVIHRSARNVNVVKDGRCPSRSLITNCSKTEECARDYDCPGSQKCCRNTCEKRSCHDAVGTGLDEDSCPKDESVVASHKGDRNCSSRRTKFGFKNNCKRWCYHPNTCNPHPGLLMSKEQCEEVLCASIRCEFPGEICTLTKAHVPGCVCRSKCPAPVPGDTVCGTDGIPYKSACELNRTACILGEKHMKIQHLGKCQPNGVKIKVSAAHKFSQVLPLYEHGTISCQFVGDPVIITWEKVGLGALPNRMVPRRNKLDITDVDLRDSGMYKCKGYDGFFTAEAEINVTINGPDHEVGELEANPMPRRICIQPSSAGYCQRHIVRWYFSSKSGLCRPFTYSGCGGNENNFRSHKECSAACGHAAGDICNLPVVEGPCKGYIPLWHYNTRTERCEQFIYGGCGGNANRFDSKRACEIRCIEGPSVSTPCLRHEREARRNKRLGLFVPRCRPDGGYDEMQCHGTVCFCMDEEGKEILGTRVHRHKPLNCTGVSQPPKEDGLTPCEQAREKSRDIPFGGSHLVRCKQDGSYEEVQCSGSTGFCWCVNKHGVELNGTKTRGPLKCPVAGIHLTLCQQQYIEQLRRPRPDQEIPRCRHDGSFEEVQCRGILCFCVDTGNGRMVKDTIINTKLGEPRCDETGSGLTLCQRLHHETLNNHHVTVYRPRCKSNGDFEELQCHGPSGECWCVDQQGREINGTRTKGTLRCPNLGKPLTSCQKEYQRFLKHWWHSFSRFVPRCTPDGSYAEVQCTGGVCYCVTPTGREIPGTRIFNAARQPNCTHRDANVTPCEERRRKAAFHFKRFVPVCKPDGSWSEIQCQRSSGECWCVDSEGNEVPGTRSAKLEKCPSFAMLSPCRKKLVNLLKNPQKDKHLPWCGSDGSFNAMQCYGSFCYCVNEDGEEISGTKTSVAVGRPVCNYKSGTVTACQRKYREAPLRYFQGVMVPRCKLNGEYEEVQCQGSMGECWCVDPDGKELPGTRTARFIQCPVLGERLSTCQQRYMEYAKDPSLGKMIPRCRGDGTFEPTQCQGLSCFCVDENGNRLSGTSLPLRLGKPKCDLPEPLTPCQEKHKTALLLPATPSRFIPTCKRDGAFEEVQCQSTTGECWCVNKVGEETLGSRTTGYIKCPSSAVSLTHCQAEYQETLRSSLLPVPYIPQCTHEGKYEPIQCQDSFCFCVNEFGVELVGTRMEKIEGTPDCTNGGYSLTLCQKRFRDFLRHPMPGRFEPRCGKTGAYKKIQCQGKSCFCVDREGTEIEGTRRNLSMGKPVCYTPGIALTPCQKRLQEVINSHSSAAKFVPRCKFDGSYEEIQCENGTGLCWCVDKDGNEMPQTATNMTASCPNMDAGSLCWTRYQQNIKSSPLGSHVPWCRSDGSFSPLQIEASQFFCVNDQGDEAPGTSVDVSLGKPDCRAARSHSHIVTPCQRERARRLYLPLMAGKYVPRCRVDGTYDDVQCDVTIGQCWCVDRDGRELRGTRTEGVIKCPTGDELTPCQKQQRKALRLSFAGPPAWSFIPRCRDDGGYYDVQCHVTTGQCWCVDENGNERWGTAVRGLPDCSNNMTSCQSHRTRTLGLTGNPPPGRYVPSCKPDGSYNEVQCHGFSGLCWCVDEKGNEILGTRKWGRPKCERVSPDHETPVDLGILIDASEGISDENWPRMLEFVSSVVDSFDVSSRGSHVGVGVFSREADIPLYFNTLQENNLTAKNVNNVVKNLPHKKGWTKFDSALLLAEEELFNEATGMRSEIPQALLLVTASSQSRDKGPYSPLATASQGLKDRGVSIYTIGIGDRVKVPELMDIASDYRNVFTVDGFGTLGSRGILVTDIIKNETNDVSMEHLCNLAPEPGQLGCLASISAFYFDATNGECRPFIYSGCGGNANNFPSYGQCLKKCKGVLPSCLAEQKQVSAWRVGHFVPTCKPSGRYEDIQCYGPTGYCWCVNEYGIESPGTRVQGTPVCSMASGFGKSTPCLEERRKALGLAGVPSLGRFVPECKADGEYEAIQCLGNTNFCWCLDKRGNEVPGTHQWGRPQCPTKAHRGSCPRSLNSSTCPVAVSQLPCTEDSDCSRSSKCCECGCVRRCTVVTSENQDMTPCERENIRSSLCPHSKAMGRFYPKCKADGGYEAVQCHEPSGACWCMDHDGNEIPGSRQIGTPNCTIHSAMTSCQREFQRGMTIRSRTPIGLFVPSCQADGSFETMQCHQVTGYCWCVDLNGNELAGTRQWGKPNCTATGKTMTACQLRHEECLDNAPPGHFVPVCKEDGSYEERQCLQSIGQCWCIDRYGNELPGTRSKEKMDCRLLAWLSPCQIYRRRALGLRGVPVVGVFVPECKADGAYEEVQCHVISGYCWCVDEYGNELPGSGMKGRPNCATKKPCEEEKQKILGQFPELPIGTYVPQCRGGGGYEATQCDGSTGFCWCIDEYGNELAGTKVRGGLNCSALTESKMSLCHDGYNMATKVNERGHFVPLCNADGSYKKLQCNPASGECWCVGKNGKEKPETRRVGKPDCDAEEKVKNCQLSPDPGPCKAYMPHWFFNTTAGLCSVFIYGGCGGNGNRFISYDECQASCHGKNLTFCEMQREINTSRSEQFIPRCEEDGSFKPVQCHRTNEECWCVDEFGMEIPGSRTLDKPKCSDGEDALDGKRTS